MRGKAAGVLVLMVLALVASASASSSSSVRMYDAKATYNCLKKRPEYRPSAWDPSQGGFPNIPASGIYLQFAGPGEPIFNKRFVPDFKVGKGPDWWIPVIATSARPLGHLYSFTSIVLFKTASAAGATFHAFLPKGSLPGLTAAERSKVRRDYVLRQNALIDFGLGLSPVPKLLRSIILGCLRTA